MDPCPLFGRRPLATMRLSRARCLGLRFKYAKLRLSGGQSDFPHMFRRGSPENGAGPGHPEKQARGGRRDS